MIEGVEAGADDGAAAAGAAAAGAGGGGADKSGPRRMLSEKQLLHIVPLSRTSIYRLEKAGKFPRSTYISANRRIWFEDEIVTWQNEINGRGRGRRNHLRRSKS
ncbi:helix-turn-helix transcriptional regulator [Bradyrhizobium elkanii]|uniref:helix-turn-helix transcriptional regulator n=1 Tax=Bradyrhizobium elkanii TaxID=29448 RepID=UPI0004220DBB|nr:AlpA family phage regulatory protein [Bradyrhizobium elkanii]